MRSVSPTFVVLAGFVVVSGAVAGCSSSAVTEPWEIGVSGDAGTGSGSGSGGSSSSGAGSGSSGVGGSTSSGGSASSGSSSGAGGSSGAGSGSNGGSTSSSSSGSGSTSSGSSSSSSSSSGGAPDSGTVTSTDGFSASRTACINKINALRATNTAVALQPLTLQNTDTVNSCVDQQATNDESKNSAHYSFINNAPACSWGSPSGSAQNECLQGYGTGPTGIESCLQDMWNEKDNANCAGCIGCTAFGGACPNCDYYGNNGPECGHYVNLSAPYFTSVACGFAGAAPSSQDGWSVQNFE